MTSGGCCCKCRFRCNGELALEGFTLAGNGYGECLEGTYLMPEDCPCDIDGGKFCASPRYGPAVGGAYRPRGAMCYRGFRRNPDPVVTEETILTAGCVVQGTTAAYTHNWPIANPLPSCWASNGVVPTPNPDGPTLSYVDYVVEVTEAVVCRRTIHYNVLLFESYGECDGVPSPHHVVVEFSSNQGTRPFVPPVRNMMKVSVGLRIVTEFISGKINFQMLRWAPNQNANLPPGDRPLGDEWYFFVLGAPRRRLGPPTSCGFQINGVTLPKNPGSVVLNGVHQDFTFKWTGEREIEDCDEVMEPLTLQGEVVANDYEYGPSNLLPPRFSRGPIYQIPGPCATGPGIIGNCNYVNAPAVQHLLVLYDCSLGCIPQVDKPHPSSGCVFPPGDSTPIPPLTFDWFGEGE
jgi:hypothetical protein